MMVLGRRAFARGLVPEDGALMDGIGALIEEVLDSSLIPSAMWGQSKKTAIYEAGWEFSPDTASAGALLLGFPASKMVRNKCLLFKSLPVYSNLI